MNLRLPLLVCLLAVAAIAETSIYVGAGPSFHAEAPQAAFNVTTGICPTKDTCALVNYSARGSVRDSKNLVYATTAGVRQVIARADGGGIAELFLLGDAGAAISASSLGFTGAAGGGITFRPRREPRWSISFAAQGAKTSIDGGWRPNIFAQIGYTFGGVK